MSMMTATTDLEFRGHADRGAGWLEKLISAVHVSHALKQDRRPDRRDLDVLGITESFENYDAGRAARHG